MTSLISNPRADKWKAHEFAEVERKLLRKYPGEEEVVSDNTFYKQEWQQNQHLLGVLAEKQVPELFKRHIPSVIQRVYWKK